MSNPFDWVVERFEREFGCTGVKAECRPLAGEVWLTLYLPDPTPAMAALAATLMAEQAASDLGLFITIKPASWGRSPACAGSPWTRRCRGRYADCFPGNNGQTTPRAY